VDVKGPLRWECLSDIWLVVSTNPSENYEFVSWDDDIPNMMGKIKAMFQTTNQVYKSIF